MATKASVPPTLPALSGWNTPAVAGKVAAVERVRPVT